MRPVAQPGDVDSFAAHLDACARVLEHFESRLDQRPRYISLVVVVAEDREDAVVRRQATECLGGWLDVPPVAIGDVVPTNDDEVRCVRHQRRDGVSDELVRNSRAAVEISEKTYAKAAQRFGPPEYRERLLGDERVVPFVEVAVRSGAHRRTDSGGA